LKPTETLILDDEHRYWLGDRRVPGVTSVIRGFAPSFGAGQWYLDRGSAVHRAVQLQLEGRLNWDTVQPEIMGRVNAVLKFIADVGLRVEQVEVKAVHPIYQYAGTVDCIGETQSGRVILDWKGTVDAASELQLGAYAMLPEAGRIARGAAVEVRDDGTYRAHWYSGRELAFAGRTFLAMLTVNQWQKQHNAALCDPAHGDAGKPKTL